MLLVVEILGRVEVVVVASQVRVAAPAPAAAAAASWCCCVYSKLPRYPHHHPHQSSGLSKS